MQPLPTPHLISSLPLRIPYQTLRAQVEVTTQERLSHPARAVLTAVSTGLKNSVQVQKALGIPQSDIAQGEILQLVTEGLLGVKEGHLALTPAGETALRQGTRPVTHKLELHYLLDRFHHHELVPLRGGISARRSGDFVPAPQKIKVDARMIEQQLSTEPRYRDQQVTVTDFRVLEDTFGYVEHQLQATADPLLPGHLHLEVLDRGDHPDPSILPALGITHQLHKVVPSEGPSAMQDGWELFKQGFVMASKAREALPEMLNQARGQLVIKGDPWVGPATLTKVMEKNPALQLTVTLRFPPGDAWLDLRDQFSNRVQLQVDPGALSVIHMDGVPLALGTEAFLRHQYGGTRVELVFIKVPESTVV